MGLLKLAPNATVPKHKDVTEEYLYILSGGGNITINGKTTDISEGSSVYMPPYAEVSYRNGDQPTKVIQIFAKPSPADKYNNWKTDEW